MEELKKKITEAMTCKFVGDYCFSDGELSEIYSRAGKSLREYEFGYIDKISVFDYETIFVAMVNSVKNWSSDEDTFWTHIAKTLVGTEKCSAKTYNVLTGAIDSLGTKNKIIYLNGERKRYYATILAHAFAPLQSTESFFDLCWQVYREDMNQVYFENDNIFEIVSNGLCSRFKQSKGEEDFSLGSQLYKFRAGIKRLAIERADLMAGFIRQTVSLINKLANGESIDNGVYYNRLLSNWWRTKEVCSQQKQAREGIISEYSAIKPRYINDNGTVYITIPAFRLLSNPDKCPWIEIYSSDGTLVYSEELLTRGSGLAMNTKACQIDINKILCGEALDVRLIITHNGTKIFDSKKSLERIFLLFNGEKEVFSQECLPGNYQLYCRNLDSLLQYPENIKKVSPSYFVLNAKEGDVLQSRRRTALFVSEKQNKNIWIYADKKKDVRFRRGESEYFFVDGELKVAAFDSTDLSDFGVNNDNIICKLQDFSKEFRDGIVYYNITEKLSIGEPKSISVFKFSSGKTVCSINVVKFNNVRIIFDKQFYYGENVSGNVRFTTDKFDNSVSFCIDQDEVSMPISDGEMLLRIPKVQWKIDNENWQHSFNSKGLWYESLNNSSILELDMPASISGNILITPTCKSLEKVEKVLNRYRLGQEIYSNAEYYDEAMVFLYVSEKERLPILNIHTKKKFIDMPFYKLEERRIMWSPSTTYIGNSNDTFKTTIYADSGDAIKSFNLNTESCEVDMSDVEDGYYTMEVLLKSSNVFKKAETLYTQKVVVGDENLLRFKNKTIEINKVMLDNSLSPTPIKTVYVDKLQFIGNIDDCLYYSGKMYFRHFNGRKTYLNTMKNDSGGTDTTNPVRIELCSNRTCWMVAGLSSNDINDFLGELFLDRYSQLSNIASGNKAINYYIYKIQEDNDVQSRKGF